MIPNPLTQIPLERLRRRTSMKWAAHPDDVLPLWVAEMDVALAEPIRAALSRAIELGDTGYPAGLGYARALRDFARERWGWDDLDIARTALVPDVMMGIVEVLRLITQPGDAVVVTPPVYPPFYAFTGNAGRRIIEAPLRDGRLDPETLADAFVRAREFGDHPAVLLSNPHNPTGAVHTRAELEQLVSLAHAHGVRIVSDEIHAPLVLEGAAFTPILTVAGAGDAFALMSASKAWNLAGLKAALVIAGPDAAADLARMPEEVSHGPSHLGVIAHTAAFREGGEWLDALLRGLAENRALLADLVAERMPQAVFHPPEGTYLAWIDLRGYGIPTPVADGAPGVVSDVAGPAKFLLDRARVAVSSGHVFGAGGAGFIRLNFATSPVILETAIDRMATALREVERP